MDPMVAWLTSTFGQGAPDVAAAMGVPPPMGPSIDQMNGVAPSMGGAPTSVWDPQPAAAQASATNPQGANQLTGALRGMAAPQVPAAQKVSTPNAPKVGDIKQGELLAMLLAASEGGMAGGRKVGALPGTLGQALSAPRY